MISFSLNVDPLYMIIELICYGVFAACLWHAWKRGRAYVLELLVAAVFGVTLEIAMINQSASYHYGRFLVMIGPATLMNGAGWAIIIYSSMAFAERLKMPAAVRPILAALLALNIDLAMDTIAIRLVDHVNNDVGMWTWGNTPFDAHWFGVPWGNFYGWFWVIALYSGFLYVLRRWREHRVGGWLYAPLAFVLSLIGLIVMTRLEAAVLSPLLGPAAGALILIVGGLIVVLAARPRVEQAGPPDLVVFAVPLMFHIDFIVAALIQGIYVETPALGVIGVSMFVIGVLVHLWPWWAGRQQPVAWEAGNSAP